MTTRAFRSDGILLLTAAIWGVGFVAQRAGMQHMGPFFYTALRFTLGALVLAPLWSWSLRRFSAFRVRTVLPPAVVAGIFLFLGVSVQQVGLVYTEAGKAGFITGLYVVIVPILSLFAGRRSPVGSWIGAFFAAAGLYLLSIQGSFSMSRGDLLVLIGAFFWAVHVLILARFAPRLPFIPFAMSQYLVCAAGSLAVAVAVEPITFVQIADTAVPILYGGAVSVGIAYTLQIVGQRDAPPTHAAVILSLEGVFAALGGMALLGERLTIREGAGCVLMLAGMLVSRIAVERRSDAHASSR